MVYAKFWIGLTISAILVILLPGCNSTGNGSSNVTHTGSVGDGPVTDATIIIADRNGVVLKTDTSDNTANYRISLEVSDDAYPLQIVAMDGIDIVTQTAPDFTMMSVATDPSQTTANINPFSTLIVRMADAMRGGLTNSNLQMARNIVVDRFGCGLDPDVLPDPIGVAITEANIAAIVKASECFGEIVRRSRDALLTLGTQVSGDQIIHALAADMIDGVLDGEGAPDSDVRTAAIVNIVSGQVLIEAMSNTLMVGNTVATQAMDDAIRISLPDAPSAPGTDSVRVPWQMIDQALRSIEAARLIAPGPELSTVAGILDALVADSLPTEIEPMLPGDTSADLDAAISATVFADDSQLDALNSTARSFESRFQDTVNDQTGGNDLPGGSSIDSQPFARPDNVTTGAGQSVTVAVLNNDSNLQDTPVRVTLSGTPAQGSAVVNSDNTVTYMPDSTHNGSDSFTYLITDTDGDASLATVTIDVVCSSNCSVTPSSITLSWDPTPGMVDGYIVYYGNSAGAATRQVASVAAPSVVLDIASELQASGGDTVCFRVSAYNSTEVSAPSNAICGVI